MSKRDVMKISIIVPIIVNILVNAIPIILILIPLLFIKDTMAKLYKRVVMGITVFYLVYFVLPAVFQMNYNIDKMDYSKGPAVLAGILYFIAKTGSTVINYFQLSVLNFTFIFLIAPFISILFLWGRLRKEDNKSFRKKLFIVTFDIKKSPREMIIDKLKSGDWSEEKRLFKLLVVLLPISLYLLTTILKIAGLEVANIQDNETALGWFLEVFFIYLAAFLFGIHLLKASNLSFKGRFIGEKLEEDVNSSLMAVGVPISALSVLLFAVEYQSSITLIIYFFGYFLMAAFIFVTYLVIFEPICIIMLIKIVNRIKDKKIGDEMEKGSENEEGEEEAKKRAKIRANIKADNNKQMGDYFIPAVMGFIMAIVFILVIGIINFVGVAISGVNDLSQLLSIINSAQFSNTEPLELASIIETMTIFNSGSLILLMFIGGIILAWNIRISKKITTTIIIFSISFILVSILLGLGPYIFGYQEDIRWVTGKLVSTNVFSGDYYVYTMRTAFLNANFDNPILYYLAIPYNYTRYISSFIIWGVLLYYIRTNFFTKTIHREKTVEQITYSQLEQIPTYNNFLHKEYLITITQDYKLEKEEREEILEMLEAFKKGKYNYEIFMDSEEENKRLYITLRYMTQNKWVEWWIPEYSFIFERAELQSLYVMYGDGRDVFSYMFKESETDPALVAGMFSAITSFIRETTKSKDLLRTIDHGDTKVIIEYGEYVFGALFADRETTQIRSQLKRFINEFEKRHREVLKNWNGNMSPFQKDDKLLKQIFELD
ncbi:MAG: hypothetical protein ACTSU2_01355 [Promethearchaeota archaeon]